MNIKKKIVYAICFFVSLLLFLTLFLGVITKNSYIVQTDYAVSVLFFNNRTRLFDFLFVLISYLGETITIALFCLVLLLLPNRKQLGLPITILTIVSFAINFVLKMLVARQRPENMFLIQETLGYKMPDGFSFPSGHSQTSNIFYFALSFYVLNNLKKNWTKIFLIVLTVLFCFLMCIARIYLCVHFLSDVLCGISIMIALFCTYLMMQESLLKSNELTYE